jgi:hypothetical protein
MSRTLGLIGGLLIVAATLATGAPVVAEETGALCDIKVSLNHAPYVDDEVTAYTHQIMYVAGTGFPSLTDIPVDVTPDGGPPPNSARTTESGRLFGYVIDSDPSHVGTFTITFSDPDNASCSDSFVLHLIGPIPYFNDVHTLRYIEAVIWAREAGVMTGCTPEVFCPSYPVSRDHMATILVRALELPPTTNDYFVDDETNRYEWAINRLAESGISTGCGVDTFCPRDAVTRAEMASFLVRGFEIAPSDIDQFTDDDESTHEADINALAAAGVTDGCSATTFCPNKVITHYELAVFLFRLLGAS